MILKFLRKKKTMKRIMWGLAIIIIPAFVIWGSDSSKNKDQNQPEYAGKIFNKKIPFEQYADMWRATRDSLVRTYGNNIPPEIISRSAWTRILLLEMAKRSGIEIKDTELFNAIASLSVFQRNGYFDKKLYKSMLGEAAKGFEEKLSDDIRIEKLREQITSGVSASDKEIKEAYKKKYEKIKASYISVHFSDFEKEVQYTDSAILEYYENNKNSFIKPEERNIKYLEVLFSEFGKEAKIGPEDIQRYFEEHLSDYKKTDSDEMPLLDDEIRKTISEKLSKNRSVSLAEELAYKTLDAAIEKKNLEIPAATFGLAVKETSFFSIQQQIPSIGWSYELAQKAFELKGSEIFPSLVKTEKAFYIIQLKAKKDPYIPDFNQAKEAVIAAFIKDASVQLSGTKAKELYADIDKTIRTGMIFEDIVKQLDLTSQTTGLISRDSYIPTIGPAEKALAACESLTPGLITKPLKMPDAWVIFKLDEQQEIDEIKFAEEKESFGQTLLEQKKQSAFNKWLDKVKQSADFVSYIKE